MRPFPRLLASSCCLATAVVLLSAGDIVAEAAPFSVGWCDEGPFGAGTAHEFGTPGACYQCAPSGSCHLSTEWGYCGEYHYIGTGCPDS